jgi:mono/diheme cytochrome c family protein
VTPRSRNGALAFPALLAAAGLVWWGAVAHRDRFARTPAALERGRAVVRGRCLHCHATIPLAPRVAGWSAERAYDALGRLPELRPAMPAFSGDDQERRAVAVYLSALGAGAAPPP